MLGETLLTFEMSSMMLIEVEAYVNSRPLCAIDSDVHDNEILTPSPFLIGEPLKSLPEPEVCDHKVDLVGWWQLINATTILLVCNNEPSVFILELT